MASTYTQQQLRAMAREALAARDAADWRWLELVMRLLFRTGLQPHEIEQRIEALAQLPETEPA